ncbi:MAG: hypothetical protein ACJAXA_001701 [Candidatus Aldehydirespiratoraceae bacterium]|jgi:hypothetical protein
MSQHQTGVGYFSAPDAPEVESGICTRYVRAQIPDAMEIPGSAGGDEDVTGRLCGR